MHKFLIVLGVVGLAGLITTLVLLVRIQNRCARIELETLQTTHAVAHALVKYEQTLAAIERRQTLIETSFTTSENLHLTITQLKSYNRFRAPQSIFVRAKSASRHTSQGGK